MSNNTYTKWVSCWGNATSITDRREAVFARDLTLRYPIFMPFSGSEIRLRFSNLTGTDPVRIDHIDLMVEGEDAVTPCPLWGEGESRGLIAPGEEATTPAVKVNIAAGATLVVSFYLRDFTQMNAGTLITGPLSRGYYAYGDFTAETDLPAHLSRRTNWFYFLNTVDVLTSAENHAVICYGDSITAQSWPDCLIQRAWQEGRRDIAFIRRAVSGTRVLRQYDCITYQAYGLKGETRFPVEMNASGVSAVIIQHGINDIIHPVGVEVNPFRPWSDMPTLNDLIRGFETIYLPLARELNYKVYVGTLLPILGWRTYTSDRDLLRVAFNDYLRTSPLYDGCIDFDLALRDANRPAAFAPGFDSGDHLHPSESAYSAMANAVPLALL